MQNVKVIAVHLASVFERYSAIAAVYAFGSYAEGHAREDRDAAPALVGK